MPTWRDHRRLPAAKSKPECGHSPYAMTYDEDRAQCGLCGQCWAMAWWPGGIRRGWKLAEIEE